jgi:hypothetical protein
MNGKITSLRTMPHKNWYLDQNERSLMVKNLIMIKKNNPTSYHLGVMKGAPPPITELPSVIIHQPKVK